MSRISHELGEKGHFSVAIVCDGFILSHEVDECSADGLQCPLGTRRDLRKVSEEMDAECFGSGDLLGVATDKTAQEYCLLVS